MRENRKEPRVETVANIPVHDINSGHQLGQLVNLSSEGMMLICPEPIEENRIFQLELPLETLHREYGSLSCGVQSLWSNEANQKGRYWVGFQIIDISPEAKEIIETLIGTRLEKPC
jgi:hypothetical protein